MLQDSSGCNEPSDLEKLNTGSTSLVSIWGAIVNSAGT